MNHNSKSLVILLLVVLALGCGAEDRSLKTSDGGMGSPAEAPISIEPVQNVLLITIDTLRADALGFMGNAAVETPILDRLAGAGRVFSWAHAHNTMTLPSHTNLLTGLYPYQHGVRDNGGFALDHQLPTIATALSEAGFATGAVVAAYSVAARYGLERGFDLYDDDFGEPGFGGFEMTERRGDEVVRLALEWWRQHEGERRFLWVHLFDPHAPYDPPEPFKTRYAESPYLGEVAATDKYLEPLLAPFLDGQEASTLIVVTADHGEALGEHGEDSHGDFAYEETLHVPLVLWGSPVAPGVDDRLARHVDVVPTVLEAVGLPIWDSLPGRSLLENSSESMDSYFEAATSYFSMGWAPLRGVLVGHTKLIELPVPELYDLSQDPQEVDNLFGQRGTAARTIAQRLPPGDDWPPRAEALDGEERRKLAALGYLTGRTASRGEFTEADDPKNLIHLRSRINRAIALHRGGNHEAAIARMRQILAERYESPLAHSHLATFLLSAGRNQEALAAMEEARSRGLAEDELLRQLGLTLVSTGRPARALEILRPLAARDHDPTTLSTLALAQGALGRLEEGLASVEEALTLAPERAKSHETQAFLLIQLQRWPAAEAAARQAVAFDATLPGAWNNLGIALYMQDMGDEALDSWRQAVRLDPRQFSALFQIGLAAFEAGDVAEARTLLQRFLDSAPEAAFGEPRRVAQRLLQELEPATPGT